jgi:hypothetical protein
VQEAWLELEANTRAHVAHQSRLTSSRTILARPEGFGDSRFSRHDCLTLLIIPTIQLAQRRSLLSHGRAVERGLEQGKEMA